MSDHTIADVKQADHLWDHYPLPIVAEKTGIPESTLGYWSQQGLIETDTDHRTRAVRKYDAEKIALADRLWDTMPLHKVSEVIDVPHNTLQKWSERGWIDTETEHRGRYQTKGMSRKVRRAAHLAHEKEITNREAARRMGVAESTFYRYLRLYRNGEYA
jgi:DNA-binding transcriptional MerR regulator